MNTILQKRIEEAAFTESSMYETIQEKNAAYNTAMKVAKFALQNQWISVEEDLPKYDVAVIAMEYNPGLSWEDQRILFAHRSKNPDVWRDKNDFCIYPPTIMKITHWMETPLFKEDKK